jgi:hypothetical protein
VRPPRPEPEPPRRRAGHRADLEHLATLRARACTGRSSAPPSHPEVARPLSHSSAPALTPEVARPLSLAAKAPEGSEYRIPREFLEYSFIFVYH